MSYCGRSRILVAGVDSGEVSLSFVQSLQDSQKTVGFVTKIHEKPIQSVSLIKNIVCTASSERS